MLNRPPTHEINDRAAPATASAEPDPHPCIVAPNGTNWPSIAPHIPIAPAIANLLQLATFGNPINESKTGRFGIRCADFSQREHQYLAQIEQEITRAVHMLKTDVFTDAVPVLEKTG